MNKTTVTVISIVSAGLFAGLVATGLHYVRGVPVPIEKPPSQILKVGQLDQEIDLAQGLAAEVWQTIQPVEIKLEPQVMVEPWGQNATSPVQVKAFHNGRDIYFYLAWHDETEDWALKPGTFTDGCALMFPLAKNAPAAGLMMGFMGTNNIWHWKASQDYAFWLQRSSAQPDYADFHYPFEQEELFPVSKTIPVSAVNDLVAVRVATLTPNRQQRLAGRGTWQNGLWQVVIKRALEVKDPETEAAFELPGSRQIAFAVWNGTLQDRGGRKAISQWVELQVQ